MYTFEKSVCINRPLQEVFDYVHDPTRQPHWQSGVESAKWTSNGQPGVGSTYTVVRSFLGRKTEAEVEITAWEPPVRSVNKTIGGPVPMEITVNLVEQLEGTQVIMKGQAEFGSFFKLAEGVVGKQAEKQIASDLQALKLLLEEG
jgi:carbon monoxide dehydrogenase subunit G